MFATPAQVLFFFLYNASRHFRRWHVTPEVVQTLERTMPQITDGLAPVIEVVMPDSRHTTAALLSLLWHSPYRIYEPLWERRSVRPVFPSPNAPIVRWRLVDLSCHVASPTSAMCLSRNEAWASVLAAAVYHHRWLAAMERGEIPPVVVPGCRLVTERWQAVPMVRSDGTSYHQWGYSPPVHTIASLHVTKGEIHIKPFDERSLVYGATIPRVVPMP